MRKNKLFEITIVLIVVLVCFTGCFNLVLKYRDNIKNKTFIASAEGFNKAVMTNLSEFDKKRDIYLEEVVKEKFISDIKSPFSSKNCDVSQSYVEFINDEAFVTLKCDNYLIEKYNISDKTLDIYNVGKWSNKKSLDDSEEKSLYNCLDKSTNNYLFSEFVPKDYFLFKISKKYGNDFDTIEEVNSVCNVSEKEFYRKRKLYKKISLS